jgi:YHS domain-containing protein
MDRDVFPDPTVQQTLRTEIAAVKIDVSHEPDLASQYGASTVPRDVVVFPDGTSETLNVGYMSKSAYLTMLRKVAVRGHEMAVPKPVEPSGGVAPQLASGASEKPVSSGVSAVSEPSIDPPIIGLERYCPVQLHDKRVWTPGLESISADYRGIRYQFSSVADRELFLKNPAVYAPQDLGCDPIVLTADQKAVTGSIRFGAFFDQKLYLFRTAENRDRFKQNPLKYTHIRSALKADQIEGTRFQ